MVSPEHGTWSTVDSQTMVVALMIMTLALVGFSGTVTAQLPSNPDDFSSRRASRVCRKSQRLWISLDGYSFGLHTFTIYMSLLNSTVNLKKGTGLEKV